MAKVLLLYGTRYGATKEISEEIEKVIQDKGISTESYNLKEHKQKKIPPLDEYDGIVIGTSIKMKMWTNSAKSFVQKRKSKLKQMQDKVGFYVCCGEKDTSKAINEYITPKLQKFDIQPTLIDAFAGVFDLTEDSPLKGMTRKIIISSMKNEEGIEDPEGKKHDYRDWDQIKEFASKFGEIVKK